LAPESRAPFSVLIRQVSIISGVEDDDDDEDDDESGDSIWPNIWLDAERDLHSQPSGAGAYCGARLAPATVPNEIEHRSNDKSTTTITFGSIENNTDTDENDGTFLERRKREFCTITEFDDKVDDEDAFEPREYRDLLLDKLVCCL